MCAAVVAFLVVCGCRATQPLAVRVTLERRLVAGEPHAFPVLRVTNRWNREIWVWGIDPDLVQAGLGLSIRDARTGDSLLYQSSFGRIAVTGGLFREHDSLLVGPRSRIGRYVSLVLRQDEGYDTVIIVNKTFGIWANPIDRYTHENITRQTVSGDFVLRGHVPVGFQKAPDGDVWEDIELAGLIGKGIEIGGHWRAGEQQANSSGGRAVGEQQWGHEQQWGQQWGRQQWGHTY